MKTMLTSSFFSFSRGGGGLQSRSIMSDVQMANCQR